MIGAAVLTSISICGVAIESLTEMRLNAQARLRFWNRRGGIGRYISTLLEKHFKFFLKIVFRE